MSAKDVIAPAVPDELYDVTVIGGGIQGCAVAKACVEAGYKTLLLEQQDWAWATSSSSSKLIHGGLRYLQSGQFKLVRECLAEREWMFKHMPDLVRPSLFYLPIYKHSRYRPYFIAMGLWLYRLLNLRSPHSRFRRLTPSQWAAITGLQQQDLIAVFEYTDGQTDDRALTKAIQRLAQQRGVHCFNHCELLVGEKNDQGYRLTLQREQMEQISPIQLQSRLVVNATGPWVNDCLSRFTPAVPEVAVDLIQGSHIIIAGQMSDHCFYVEAPEDKRAVFIMPWQGQTLVGTTELRHTGGAHQAEATEAEIRYLQQTVRAYFPDQNVDVVRVFCGLRVLPKSSAAAFGRSREVMLQQSAALISIYGGKLTAWRTTSKSVLTLVETQMDKTANV